MSALPKLLQKLATGGTAIFALGPTALKAPAQGAESQPSTRHVAFLHGGNLKRRAGRNLGHMGV